MSHPVFGMLPPLRPHVTLRIATDGGNSTVNKATPGTRWATAGGRGGNPFRQVAGAGLRFVIDMAAPDEARFVVATGQSGNPYSSLFGSFLQRWRDGVFVTIGRAPESPPAGGVRLLLEPGGD